MLPGRVQGKVTVPAESTGRSAGRLADEEVNGPGGPVRSPELTDRPGRLLEDFPVPVGAAVADGAADNGLAP